MKVRELLVTDVRCHECFAGPGERCYRPKDFVGPHQSRIDEHAELVAAGWEWQEVDPRDKGAKG